MSEVTTAPVAVRPQILPILPSAPTETGPIAISLRNVGMTYADGSVVALRDISIDVLAGRHLCVLGASGSGKTTLLSCLSGRLAPTTGTVTCHGRIATIHQDLHLVRQQTAIQNVLHGALGRQPLWRTIFRFPINERTRAADLLRRVGLAHRIHAPVSRLSGGEQQRVAIARALMQDPNILLADEPIASLDNANARAIMGLLCDLQKERKLTLVSVLHDCALAETFADRIVSFDAGRIIYDQPRCHEAPCVEQRVADAQAGRGRFNQCGACDGLRDDTVTGQRAAATSAAHQLESPRRRPWAYVLGALIALVVYGWAISGLHISARETENLFGNVVGFIGRMLPDSWSQLAAIEWMSLTRSLVATLQMALLGTTLAVLISWPLAARAARNVGPRWLRPLTRFILNSVRAVPSIIWALLFVCAVGLGAFAGVLALVAYSIGYLTKFFYEAFEAVDPGPPDALAEIGAGGLQRFLHAVWPAGRAAVLSSSLFMLEYNVRAASVLGIVGAGGIGHDLKLHVDWGNFHVVGAILLMLVVVVLVLDAISSRIRARLARA